MPVKVTYKGKVKITKFKRLKFVKTLKRNMEVQQREAIRVWTKEALKHIPTYTGTARGTFKPISRAVGKLAIKKYGAGGAAGAKGNLQAARKKKYFVYPKNGKRWKLGFAEGENYSEAIISNSETTEELIYKFVFNNRLLYVLWNDIYPAPQWIKLPSNPPWKAVEQGGKAWENYVTNEIPKKIPRVKDHLVISNA